MNVIDEYKRERRRLSQLNYRLRKKGFKELGLPPIPKRITKGSIRKLSKIIAKQLLASGNDKKAKKKTSTKKKSTSKKKTTKKKTTSKKKPTTKKKDKYLPSEKDRIIDNVKSTLYSIEDIENLINNMYISSKRGNNTHRANVYDLSRVLRSKLDNALFEDGELAVAKRLKDNSELVAGAIETIEGYYSESDEEELKEAIDKIEELISVISGEDISRAESQSLEDIFSDTMSFYELDDTVIEKGDILVEPKRNIKDKYTDEILEYAQRPMRVIIDSETGEVLDTIII